MNIQNLKLIILALALVLMGHTAEAGAQTNLLQNPSFEQPYGSNGEADKWGRWHRNSSQDQFGDCLNGYHKLPHWSPEANPALVRNGSTSQHIGNNWDTWYAGVFQTVPVTPGTTYRFSVWAYSFASNEDFPTPSDGSLNSNMRVGIDPNGNGVWNDGDVVWSSTINPLDTWQQVSLEVTATGNQITVFTSANWGIQGVNQCRRHIDSWFDQAELIAVGPPPTNTPLPVPTQPPPPPATNTPVLPTATATVPAAATAVPTSESLSPTTIPTDTPAPGGTICVNAFADENGNGEHDANEGFMGGVTFTVATATQLTGQAVSTGTTEPVCFEGLLPGQYTITQLIPGSLQMTTAASTAVDLQLGTEVEVEFGSRIQTENPTPAATEVAEVPGSDAGTGGTTDNDAESGSSSSSASPLAIGGIVLLILAVIMLGVLIFLVLRGQRAGNQ